MEKKKKKQHHLALKAVLRNNLSLWWRQSHAASLASLSQRRQGNQPVVLHGSPTALYLALPGLTRCTRAISCPRHTAAG